MAFIKYSIQTVVVNIVLLFINMAASIVTARWLGPEGVGIFALLLLAKTFAFNLGNLGFGSAFAFYVAKNRAFTHHVLRIVWQISFILSLCTSIFLLAIWRYDISPWKNIHPSLFYLSLVTIPATFLTNYFQRILSGELRITAMNISNIILGASNVVLQIFLIIIFKLGVLGAILSRLLADFLCLFYLTLQLRKEHQQAIIIQEGDGNWKLIYRLWCYGRWNYLLMFVNYCFEKLPLFLLKTFLNNNAAVGFFSRAASLKEMSNLLMVPLSRTLFPFTAASKKQDATLRTNVLCRNFLLIMGFLLIPIALCVKPFILILYGEEFLPTVTIFYTLLPGLFIKPLGRFLGIHIAAIGRPRAVFFGGVGTLVIGTLICLFLIPLYGMIGAGLSLSLMYFTWSFFRLIIYIRITGTSLSQVLLPHKGDWVYYQHFLKILPFRFRQNSTMKKP